MGRTNRATACAGTNPNSWADAPVQVFVPANRLTGCRDAPFSVRPNRLALMYGTHRIERLLVPAQTLTHGQTRRSRSSCRQIGSQAVATLLSRSARTGLALMYGTHQIERLLVPALRAPDLACKLQESGRFGDGPAGSHQEERRQSVMTAIRAAGPHVRVSKALQLGDRTLELVLDQARGFHLAATVRTRSAPSRQLCLPCTAAGRATSSVRPRRAPFPDLGQYHEWTRPKAQKGKVLRSRRIPA